jgi:hypothetical protein
MGSSPAAGLALKIPLPAALAPQKPEERVRGQTRQWGIFKTVERGRFSLVGTILSCLLNQ